MSRRSERGPRQRDACDVYRLTGSMPQLPGRAEGDSGARGRAGRGAEPWEPETTARNLRPIREARERRRDDVPWAREIEGELEQRAR
jgi:hypothetical protein